MKRFFTLACAFCAVTFNIENANAQLVTSSADDGSDGTLRQEIADTPAGGEITFAESVAVIMLNSELLIDKALTVTGSDSGVSINANDNGRIFNITGGPVTLTNLNILNGQADDGGGIYIIGADLSLVNSTIFACTAAGVSGSGGGIFVDTGASLTATNSNFFNNVANRAGGAIEDNSGEGLNIILTDVDLNNNTAGLPPATAAAPGNGGAIHATTAGMIEINGGQATGNTAAAEGGAFWNNGGTMMIDGTILNFNAASGDDADNGGGALYNNGGTMVVMNVTADNNTADGAAGSGGAVLNNGGSLTVSSSSFSGNSAQRAGGAIEDASVEGGVLTLDDNDFSENSVANSPGNGGAVHVGGPGDSNISDGSANGNTAGSEGGAFWNNIGTMTVDGTSFDGNTASGADAKNGGGALYNNGGTMVVTNVTADNNTADGAAGSGGAVLNNGGSLTVSSSSFSGNSAQRAGGAIEDASAEGGVLTLDDNDFSENSVANSPGNGGAVHVGGPGDSNISDGSANGNTAGSEGGAFWNNIGTMTVDGTSFDGNTASGADAKNGGGALYNNGGTMVVTNVTADNNTADGAAGSGGAVLNNGGSLTVSASSFSGNSAQRAGGAIEDASAEGGVLTLDDNDFSENSVANSPGNGGAVHVGGPGDSNISGGSANGNTAGSEGGAFWNNVGTMTVDGTSFDANTASGADDENGGGALYNNGGTMVVMNAIADNNTADGASGSGGAVLNNGGSLTVSSSSFSGNSAQRAGGAIEDASAEGGVLTLNDNDFSENSVANSPGNGGAVHVGGPGDSNISGGSANGNTAGSEGGAFWNNVGTMTVDGTSFDGNTASGAEADNGGGALYNNGGTMVVMNITADNNTADGAAGSGGALLSTAGSVTVTNSTFSGNAANRAGGAIEIVDGDLDFSDSDMINNDVNGTAGTAAPGNGGALHVTGMMGNINILRATVSGNEAANEGGGLWNQSGTTMNVTASTISGNSTFSLDADAGGGGIYNNGGMLNVTVSTISGNSSAGSGGGLLNSDGGVVDINASTIAVNTTAIDGGGIFSLGTTILKNTIVALNSAASGQDVSGSVSSNGYNLISEDDQNAFAEAATDIEGVDPDLGPLQDNGGPTATHALLAGSAGIDAGDPADNFNDQRGFAIVGTRDIGAFEFGANAMGPDCDNYVYYLADHTFPDDISDLYQVNIVDGNGEMTYIATCPDEVHIAYNEANGLVYAVRKDDGAIKSIDPNADSPEYSDALLVDASFSQITQAVFSQDGKLLVSSANQDITYSIDVMNGNAVTVFDGYSPIEGGDLAYALDGSALYMATREGNGGLYSIFPDGVQPDQFIAALPSNVTGMATMLSGNLLITANGNSSLLVKGTDGSDVASLPLMLNGETFILNDGDLASGCADGNPVVTSDCNGGSVLIFSPGMKKNGQPITDPERTNPNKALGAPQIDNTLNFVSLGFGGSITLGFDGGSAFNGPGDDILVVETTYGDIAGPESDFSIYPESAEVFVSQDDVNYFSVGTVFTDQAATFEIDNAGQGFTFITSVRIVDTTPLSSISGDAFDLDGISALNGCGANDEDDDEDGEAVALQSEITSFPNPTSGPSQVVFTTAVTGKTLVEVYDMNGRNVSTLFNQVAEKGLEYRLDFNGSALPNGMYIYKLTTNNETIIDKMLIAR